MKDFRNLTVWARAHDLTLATYELTTSFPRAELFGLTAQMRRAAVSIAGNIAEGCGRGGDLELRRFLYIALGSASELEYYLLLARDLELLSHESTRAASEHVDEVKRMLATLMKVLGSKPTSVRKNAADS